MEIVLQGRSTLGPGRLDVKRTLKQLLTLSSDVGGLTDPIFQRYLTIIKTHYF
jgi:hypothetical protein